MGNALKMSLVEQQFCQKLLTDKLTSYYGKYRYNKDKQVYLKLQCIYNTYITRKNDNQLCKRFFVLNIVFFLFCFYYYYLIFV